MGKIIFKAMEQPFGTTMTVAFPNIFMAKIEKELLTQSSIKRIFWK